MSDSILQRELDEAKASVTVTYWHLFQTTENLLKEIARLSSRNTQLTAENERQRVLLAALKREPATPRTIDGGESSRGATDMTIALDVNGYPWLCDEGGWWRLVKDVVQGKRSELHPLLAPYTIAYPPTPKENTNE